LSTLAHQPDEKRAAVSLGASHARLLPLLLLLLLRVLGLGAPTPIGDHTQRLPQHTEMFSQSEHPFFPVAKCQLRFLILPSRSLGILRTADRRLNRRSNKK